jgi:spermidine synthase
MLTTPIIYQLNNEFGSFTVEELDYEGRPARVLFSGPRHAAQSGMPLDGNPKMLFDYNQRFLELALELEPNRILVLGGGTLTLPSALLRVLSRVDITVVDINKDLITLAETYFGYTPNRRLKIIIDDAETVMKKNKKNVYDLIIVDLYNNFIIPEKFRTTDFALLINQSLASNGLVAINCIAGLAGEAALPAKQLISIYVNTIGSVKTIQADNNYTHWSPQNLIIMAAKNRELDKTWLNNYIEVSFADESL